MVAEVKKLGRISVIDLADVTGVDLYYVEKLAQSIVTDHAELMLNQGEIITESYWDSIAEEINERLQECSQIALTELAAQLNVGLDLIASILEPRLGTIVSFFFFLCWFGCVFGMINENCDFICDGFENR